MAELAQWWDSVELWLTGLPYVPQVALVLVALVLIAIVVVRLLSGAIDVVADALQVALGRASSAEAAGRGREEGNEDGV